MCSLVGIHTVSQGECTVAKEALGAMLVDKAACEQKRKEKEREKETEIRNLTRKFDELVREKETARIAKSDEEI